ncbi:dnaJ (Hsp40) homolog, subfamily C, member 30b isoform X2 [Osmerus eperlanus]|uniref:dnaJ (Hsp40) homolog, subfamily C, member 30b isoform X1 n=1 Tax=Osmerus eperlanus TaxID=29151 RepID=UPI002E0F4783
MAEVSRRLGSVAYRLSALKNSPSHSFSNAECHGTASATSIAWTCNSEVVAGQRICECQPVSRDTLPGTGELDTRNFKDCVLPDKDGKHCNGILCRRKGNNGDVYATCLSHKARVTSCDFCSLDSDAKSLISLSTQVSEYASHLYRGCSMLPVPRLKVWRMVSWEDRSVVMVKVHPETFGSSPQRRAFSTVIFTVTGPGSGLRLALPRPHPAVPAAVPRRAYSRGSKDGDPDLLPLYRSRTVYYDLLRVTPSATQSQIKTAYFKQSFLHHPDKNPGSEVAVLRFSEISEAYSILGSVALRRKYDRGILSQADVQGAGRPSAKETMATSRGGQQQQREHATRSFSRAGGKPIFDFDAFYQAHYGEQLEREKQARERRERQERAQKHDVANWKVGKMLEMTVMMLLATGGCVLFSLRS